MEDKKNISKISDLLKADRVVQVINLITLYRTIAFPFLLIFIFTKQLEVFKWLLMISFLTDAVDGYLARTYQANSVLGAKLDSIGDDLTVLGALIGLAVFRMEFLVEQWIVIAIPLLLFVVQLIFSLFRYKKISSFHTYLAKSAAVLQGLFLCAIFLFEKPVYWLFYAAIIITTIELIEEIIIVILLPRWTTNVRGLFWVLKSNGRKHS